MAGQDQDAALAELRREIDRLDREMHERLMERGRIIERLIEVKGGTAATGSAFRPEREAAMMRTLARRHEGGLPFDAIEGIWRIVISTFTHQQAPFRVHVDGARDLTTMRDGARFHFGFTVPLDEHQGPDSVIAAVRASRGDLGLIAVSDPPKSCPSAWWRLLEPDAAPKVIARLPFLERAGHPAAHPILVIAKSVSGEGLGATLLYSAAGLPEGHEGLAEFGGRIVASTADAALIAAPRDVEAKTIAAALAPRSLSVIGSHPSIAPD